MLNRVIWKLRMVHLLNYIKVLMSSKSKINGQSKKKKKKRGFFFICFFLHLIFREMKIYYLLLVTFTIVRQGVKKNGNVRECQIIKTSNVLQVCIWKYYDACVSTVIKRSIQHKCYLHFFFSSYKKWFEYLLFNTINSSLKILNNNQEMAMH